MDDWKPDLIKHKNFRGNGFDLGMQYDMLQRIEEDENNSDKKQNEGVNLVR